MNKADSAAERSGVNGEIAITDVHPMAAAGEMTVAEAGAGAGNSSVEPAEGKKAKAKAKVVAIEFEEVPDSFIQHLLKKGTPQRPKVRSESFFQRFPDLREVIVDSDAWMNLYADVQEDIVKQYHEKGRAVVKNEVLDDGTTRFGPPEKSSACLGHCRL